ncbi:MAG: exopolysaccharide biosynthesis polyprenyl glycosylphosphotransferase [Deferribacteraceae bacterium]|jgi:undecaprenyl-phosphate galactose phosphotransferase|nr:exopolysaccharide biosynthesis polyprenyl glycosylphosphotransferase [Deferribacteraceae bacterium]
MKQYKQSVYLAALLLSDILAYYAALFLSYTLRVLSEHWLPVLPLRFNFFHFLTLWWIPAFIIFFLLITGVYHRRDPFWIESGKVLKALFYAAVLTFAAVTLGHLMADVSRFTFILLFFFLPIFMLCFRYAIKNYLYKGGFRSNALAVGDKKRLQEVVEAFENDKFMRVKAAARFAADTPFSKIEQAVKDNNIDIALVAGGAAEQPLFSKIHRLVGKVYYIPDKEGLDLTNAETGQLLRSQVGYILLSNSLQTPFNQQLKRIFDLCLAVITAPLILPIIALLALIVRLNSPGGAIFSHERIGRNGKKFRVYKLRSMHKDAEIRLKELLARDPKLKAEWDESFKLKDDPRVTRLGKFLRKTSLDELPQFFNVFLGDMSFVGPRPVLKEELERYYGEDYSFYYKLTAPGITGLWQVSGRSDTSYPLRVAQDAWYVYNWTLWLDIVLIFSTPLAVLRRRGAY